MRVNVRLAAGLFAVLALVLLAGCGGEGDDRFADDVVATRNDVDATLQHMADSTTYDQLIDRLGTASENIDLAADRIADTDPPDDLRDERDELERSYRALSQEVGATGDALEDVVDPENPQKLEGLSFTNWDRVQRALAALREQGIEVPPLERY